MQCPTIWLMDTSSRRRFLHFGLKILIMLIPTVTAFIWRRGSLSKWKLKIFTPETGGGEEGGDPGVEFCFQVRTFSLLSLAFDPKPVELVGLRISKIQRNWRGGGDASLTHFWWIKIWIQLTCGSFWGWGWDLLLLSLQPPSSICTSLGWRIMKTMMTIIVVAKMVMMMSSLQNPTMTNSHNWQWWELLNQANFFLQTIWGESAFGIRVWWNLICF